MAGVRTLAVNESPRWFEGAAKWNRRVSLTVAVVSGLTTFLLGWALTIKFGSWFGVFLGWWPALFVASLVALVAARAWPALPLLALVISVSGDRDAAMASSAVVENQTIAAGAAGDRMLGQRQLAALTSTATCDVPGLRNCPAGLGELK